MILTLGLQGTNSVATCWCPRPGTFKYILVAELGILSTFLRGWMYSKFKSAAGSLEIKDKGHVNKGVENASWGSKKSSLCCDPMCLLAALSFYSKGFLHFSLKTYMFSLLNCSSITHLVVKHLYKCMLFLSRVSFANTICSMMCTISNFFSKWNLIAGLFLLCYSLRNWELFYYVC